MTIDAHGNIHAGHGRGGGRFQGRAYTPGAPGARDTGRRTALRSGAPPLTRCS